MTANNKLDVQEIIKSVLKNRDLEFLHNAYTRGKKKPYANQNWMIRELSRWGMTIPECDYRMMYDVQIALVKLDNINVAFAEHALRRLVKKCGDKYYSMDKYKQARLLYRAIEADYGSPLQYISWIKQSHLDVYTAISADSNWFKQLQFHIDHIHTALHGHLRNVLTNARISFSNRDGIVRLYELLVQVSVKQTSEISLIATDKELLTLLNEARNNKSLAHPNKLEIIPSDIGLAFLKQLSLLVQKISIISRGV